MDWEAIGAVADAIGAIGVMASLVYLSVQVRASTRASAVEAKLTSTRLLTDFIDQLIQTPELDALFRRGLADLGSLSQADLHRFSNLSLKAFWYFSAGWFQHRAGTLTDDDWHEIRAVIRFWLRGPGVRAWWARLGRASFGPEFRAFIDAEIVLSDAEESRAGAAADRARAAGAG